ncbi:hypothetical protein PUR23_28080 [Methylorubrum populi]|jgi:hypothetical protein|uniref:hypothetical protein n=1 Tax=Methylorubrum TaxID=2282523 RepID=UPI000680FF6B|nr:hypothetical protein [Methylorubrum extorquens]MDV2986888.1 hypothetical protein [Methylobacteriaceae bacterium AG10]PZP65772.1 MAG: hypothetical protein DI590_26160 [Methylorubrum populi]
MARFRKSHLVRQDVTRLAPGTDARWRAEHRQALYERALIGLQPDLFGAAAVEVFRALPKAPRPEPWIPDYTVEYFHDLSPDEQARRLAADPQTPFARTTRSRLSKEETAALVAGAANWLRVGQRVRITSAPLTLDGEACSRVGRKGLVWRLCSPVFADHVYVNLDLVGAERSEKIAFLELRDIEPI